MTPTSRTFAVRYDLQTEQGRWTPADLQRGSQGLADAFLLVSINRDEQGVSTGFAGMDGETGKPLDDEEIFKVWSKLALHLAGSSQLGHGRRGVALATHEAIKQAILAARGLRPSLEPVGYTEGPNGEQIPWDLEGWYQAWEKAAASVMPGDVVSLSRTVAVASGFINVLNDLTGHLAQEGRELMAQMEAMMAGEQPADT